MNAQTTYPILAMAALLFMAGPARANKTFDEHFIYFERNVTDGDTEAVLKVKGDDSGFAMLEVVAPDGRILVDFASPGTELGIRSLEFESPEPGNHASVQADYPEGEYGFYGLTRNGGKYWGKTVLSHEIPAAVSLIHPRAGAENIPGTGLRIEWRQVPGVAGYLVDIEQEDTDIGMTARLPGDATGFLVPDGFLVPETTYKVAVGSIARNGNRTFMESEFTTATRDY